MKKIFVFVSCLMAISVLFASCEDTLAVEPSNEVVNLSVKGGNGDDENHSYAKGNGLTDTLLVNVVKAGDFLSIIKGIEMDDIHNLRITGCLNAKDFNDIKWNVLNIHYLDLSDVVIEAYYGEDGTNEGYVDFYSADEIPQGAFFYWCSNSKKSLPAELYDEGYHALEEVILPKSIKSIGRNAFARNYNLKRITFQEGLERIGFVAFRYCTSVETFTLPSTIKEIGLWTFTAMPSLTKIYCLSKVPPAHSESFGGVADVAECRGCVDPTTFAGKVEVELYVPQTYVGEYVSSDWKTYFQHIYGLKHDR